MMATSSSTPANDDFHKLLLVVKDLAHQLDENRQATTKLKLHADLLKEQLQIYRFSDSNQNAPRSTSAGRNAIDQLLAERDELLRENQSLRQENQEIAELLKDYERGMESTTEIIRDHAYQASIRTSQIHQEYNQRLTNEQMENERLQQTVFEAEGRLIKVSGLLRQAHFVDHEADRGLDQALLDLQTQNRGLRKTLGLPIDAATPSEKEALSTIEDEPQVAYKPDEPGA